MTPSELARKHMAAARAEAAAEKMDGGAVIRAMLSAVIASLLESESVAAVRAELANAADNADPDTDYAFMRP